MADGYFYGMKSFSQCFIQPKNRDRNVWVPRNQEGKMLLPRFEFHEPATVEEACRILGELGAKAKTLGRRYGFAE